MAGKTSGNVNLSAAKTAKKDEFYTQLTDIEKEMRYYRYKEATVSKMEIVQKEGGRNVRRKPGMSQDS